MNQRYTSLDGLRSIAAIGIVIMHVLANLDTTPDKSTILYGTVIPSLTNFVYLFFSISAFAMCCGYYERMKSGQIFLTIIGAVIFSHVFKYIIFPKIEPYTFKNTK